MLLTITFDGTFDECPLNDYKANVSLAVKCSSFCKFPWLSPVDAFEPTELGAQEDAIDRKVYAFLKWNTTCAEQCDYPALFCEKRNDFSFEQIPK